jgi:hypothetical protein
VLVKRKGEGKALFILILMICFLMLIADVCLFDNDDADSDGRDGCKCH